MFPPWAQAWQTLWCSTAQHSSSVMWLISCHVTWMLRTLSLNHSLSHAILQPFSASLYISLIFHYISPLLYPSFLIGISPPGFLPTFQQTVPWSLLFLPPSQNLHLRRVPYFMQSFGLHHQAKDFKGMSNKASFPIKKAKQMFIKKKSLMSQRALNPTRFDLQAAQACSYCNFLLTLQMTPWEK